MELVEIDNSLAGKVRDGIRESIVQLRNDPLPVDFPDNLKRYREKIADALERRIPLPDCLLSNAEIEALRVQKHKNSAFLILGFMGSDPQPVGSKLHQDRLDELEKEKELGGFDEDDLRKEMAQRRANDPLNPTKGVDIQRKLMNELKGTPQYKIAGEKARAKKEKAVLIVGELRRLHENNELFSDNFKIRIALLREALLGGFTKEQLQGGTFFPLSEVGTSREELDSFDPNKKPA